MKDKQSLIESIFNNIDIGKFVFIRRSFKTKGKLYEILDGKQRMNALIDFYEDRFEYNGKKFSELNWRDQRHIEGYSIAWGEACSETGDEELTDKQKYQYFLKLNTGGKPQDPEHIKYVEKLLKGSESGEVNE